MLRNAFRVNSLAAQKREDFTSTHQINKAKIGSLINYQKQQPDNFYKKML